MTDQEIIIFNNCLVKILGRYSILKKYPNSLKAIIAILETYGYNNCYSIQIGNNVVKLHGEIVFSYEYNPILKFFIFKNPYNVSSSDHIIETQRVFMEALKNNYHLKNRPEIINDLPLDIFFINSINNFTDNEKIFLSGDNSRIEVKNLRELKRVFIQMKEKQLEGMYESLYYGITVTQRRIRLSKDLWGFNKDILNTLLNN